MSPRVNPSKLQWIKKPSLYIISSDKLVVETEPYTSFHIDKEENTAVRLVGKPRKEFDISAMIGYNFKHPEDECGLVVEIDKTHWIKFGIKRENNELNHIFVEKYDSHEKDYSERDFGIGIDTMYLKIKHHDGRILFQYGFNKDRFWTAREIQFEKEYIATVGIYACSPGNSYFDCTFSSLEMNEIRRN